MKKIKISYSIVMEDDVYEQFRNGLGVASNAELLGYIKGVTKQQQNEFVKIEDITVSLPDESYSIKN
nr:MAG TPA: hypothetical protein [Caudoviricetes sp.]